MELDRASEACREDISEGSVGERGGRCCRILRRPHAPSPCSCSVITGDLIQDVNYCSYIRNVPARAPSSRLFQHSQYPCAGDHMIARHLVFFRLALASHTNKYLIPHSPRHHNITTSQHHNTTTPREQTRVVPHPVREYKTYVILTGCSTTRVVINFDWIFCGVV